MEENEAEDVSEWKKLKKTLTVNKPLVPLKLTMLLYYGGKESFNGNSNLFLNLKMSIQDNSVEIIYEESR